MFDSCWVSKIAFMDFPSCCFHGNNIRGFLFVVNGFFKSFALLHPNQQINLCDAHAGELRLRQVKEHSLQEQILFSARSGGRSVNSLAAHPCQDVSVQHSTFTLRSGMKQKESCGLWTTTMHTHEVLQCGSSQIERKRLCDCLCKPTILTNLCGNKSIMNASLTKLAQIIKRILFVPMRFVQEARQALAGIVAILPRYKQGKKPECLEFCVSAVEGSDVFGVNHGDIIIGFYPMSTSFWINAT